MKQQYIEKFADVEVCFLHYYKFCFYYLGKLYDETFVVEIGGTSECIYRWTIGFDDTSKVKDLEINEIIVLKNNEINYKSSGFPLCVLQDSKMFDSLSNIN